MDFGSSSVGLKTGRYLGFVISYCVFTTILFLVLSFLGKIPASWSWIHIAAITLAITGTGLALKKVLHDAKFL